MILATRTTMKTTLLFMQHSLLTQTRNISRPALSFGVAARRRNSIPSFNTFTLRSQHERSTKPALLLQTQAYSGKGSHNDHKKIVALQHSYIFGSNPDVKKKDVIGPLQGQSKRNAHAVSANKSKKQKNSKQKKINKSRSEKLCVSGKKIEEKSNSVLESVIKEISSIKKLQKLSLLKTEKKEMVKNDACKRECTKIPGEDLQRCSNKKVEGISTVEGKGKGKSKSFGNDLPGDDSLSEKDVALREALTQISSNFGKEAIMWLGRFNGSRNVPAISTGSVSLDVALGIGGLPKGRVVEIYGPEASGKTTLSLHVIAESQRNGGYCAFIDAEHALDPTLAESIGVDTNNLLLAQPDCGEQALSVVDTLVRCGAVDVVVIDSVAALVPKSELEGEMGDAHMALQARLMSQALRKLTPSLSRSQTLVIFTNQIRHKLNTFGGSFGAPAEVTAGGNALKFYASVRLNVRRIGYIKKGDQVTGSQVLIKVVKNKLAPPLKTAELEIEFGRGISSEAEVLDLGCKQGLITKSGSFYTINEHRVHGKDAAKEYLKENEEVKYALYLEIKENLFHASNDNINGKEDDIENTDETTSSPNTDTRESDEVAETEVASVA